MPKSALSKYAITTGKGAALAILAYCFAHVALRLLTSWNLGENDPQILLHIQQLNWQYEALQPALFDWLAWLISKVTGPSVLIFQLLRYGLLAIALIFVFLSVRQLTSSGVWGVLALEAYALIYQLSWRMHEGFTHPMLAFAAIAAFFYAFVQYEKSRSSWAFAGMFCACVIGFLSNLWFAGFSILFLLSALFFMPLVVVLRIAVMMLIAASPSVISFSNGLGLERNLQALRNMLAENVGVLDALDLAGEGLLTLAPLLPLFFLVFPQSFKSKFSALPKSIRLVALLSALSLTSLLLMGWLGFNKPAEHATLPLFFLTPIFFVALAASSKISSRELKAFTSICLTLMVVAFGARAANLIVNEPVCKRCYFAIAYKGLLERLELPEGSEGVVLVSPDRRVVGNLLAYDQNKLFESYSTSLPNNKPAVVVVEERFLSYLENVTQSIDGVTTEDIQRIDVPRQHIWRETGELFSRFYVLSYPAASQN